MIILETRYALRNAVHKAGLGLAFKCGDCGKVEELGQHGLGTGYAYAGPGDDEKPICYDCCGKRDVASMKETGKATLYLTHKRGDGFGTVSNWPGTAKFKGGVRQGRHNIAGRRYDVWFVGPDGRNWHGVTYGDNTQICHCKRLKA